MINTYQTSLAPPPVPPRLNRSHPVLIPAPLPSPGHNKPLIRFLVGVVVLHLLLSVGGFIYLYTEKMEKQSPQNPPSTEGGKAAFHSAEKQETFYKALAGMVVLSETEDKATPGYLQWDTNHSVRRNINYFYGSWLTVLQSGDYYVYSRVTFSKGDAVNPLTSRIMLRKNKTEKEKIVMQAYCSLGSHPGNSSGLCTATQGEVIRLEKGNQLGVWTENLSLVSYTEGATTFGMYQL
ncbi:tumor necrosis factor ligand superfamily member 6-like [Lates japonicus]|uniref:Tumor necrosis factor ligand superfamily member 6-like protein n=1 Tax=Lates japonicus TaxID=270547 RepID=A0AAD3RM34_LATJO|nr:tumor necrosis factor ligand superfamily member 6-like protein [Lates japonicus]GLD73441.1 tumor necrosis factor ligand superfamily member 6-like protein [Lates japonicus]